MLPDEKFTLSENHQANKVGEKPTSHAETSKRILQYTAFSSIVLAFITLLVGILYNEYSVFVSAGLLMVSGLQGIIAQRIRLRVSDNLKAFIQITLLFTGLVLLSIRVLDIYTPISVFIIGFTLLVSSAVFTGIWSTIVLILGILQAVLAALVSLVFGTRMLSVTWMLIVMWIVAAIVLVLYSYLLRTNRLQVNLRIKLTLQFLSIALIPLIIISIIQVNFLQEAVQTQANTALYLAAEQVAKQLDNFVETNLTDVETQASLSVFREFLNAATLGSTQGTEQEASLLSVLATLRTGTGEYLPSYQILNPLGYVVYDTNPTEVGKRMHREIYFLTPRSTDSTSFTPVSFNEETGDSYIYFSAPVKNERLVSIGVLTIRYDAMILQSILEQYTGSVGNRTYPILLDENFIRLADTITPNNIHKSIVPLQETTITTLQEDKFLPNVSSENLSTNLPEFFAALQNYEQQPYFVTEIHPDSDEHLEAGAITRLSTLPWYVVFVENQAQILQVRDEQLRVAITIVSVIAGIVGVIGALVSAFISQPITQLTSVAQRVASGDLQAKAEIKSRDEIEILGSAFNQMTDQLNDMILGLETRVEERTRQLAEQNVSLVTRSRQLQTVSDVARGIAQAQELEVLLNRVVTLISERFGFYHVGVFLLDEQKRNAVLRATNSEGGQRMLARRHQLQVGQVGIVGYVTQEGKPRIATDVGQDAVFFNNPDLPETRSEMALPLNVSGEIIGALDVQSTQTNAFSEEDIELFTTLADQVAIAIYNNRLLQNTQEALGEAQKVTRQYLDQQWEKETTQRPVQGFEYSSQGIRPISTDFSPEIQAALSNGEIVSLAAGSAESITKPTLVVPIKVRGETIGVIHLEEDAETRKGWSTDEIETVRSVADQIGLALENARLFGQTIRRAERERKVLEITSKIRSVTDPKAMMAIARAELQKALQTNDAKIQTEQQADSGETASENGTTPEA